VKRVACWLRFKEEYAPFWVVVVVGRQINCFSWNEHEVLRWLGACAEGIEKASTAVAPVRRWGKAQHRWPVNMLDVEGAQQEKVDKHVYSIFLCNDDEEKKLRT
jgi:hypothetical protein